MKSQKRYYDFASNIDEDGDIDLTYGFIYSFTDDDLVNGVRLNITPKLKIECLVFGDSTHYLPYLYYGCYREESLERLSLLDAIKKGIRTIFTEL